MRKTSFLVAILCAFLSSEVYSQDEDVYSQLGVKGGINITNESEPYSTNIPNGYVLGIFYQSMPLESGFGGDIGMLFSQKHYSFSDADTATNITTIGYKQTNYLNVPFNVRYRFSTGFLGMFVHGGMFTGIGLSGQKADQTANPATISPIEYGTFFDRIDFGYQLGFGLEFFNKFQVGAEWSNGLKNKLEDETANLTTKTFSVNLTYLFY